jgi:hypothetical protein
MGCVCWNLTLACLADGRDFASANKYRHFGLRRFTVQVDDGDVSYREGVGVGWLLGTSEGSE